jgi:hypothetical protein
MAFDATQPSAGQHHWLAFANTWSGGVPAPYPVNERYGSPFHAPHTWQAGGEYYYFIDNPSHTFWMRDPSGSLYSYLVLPPSYEVPYVFATQYKGNASIQVRLRQHRPPPMPTTDVFTNFGSYALNSPNSWGQLTGSPINYTVHEAYNTTSGYYDQLVINVSGGSVQVYQTALVELCGVTTSRGIATGRAGDRQTTFQQ